LSPSKSRALESKSKVLMSFKKEAYDVAFSSFFQD
jgi:hypothetical protein